MVDEEEVKRMYDIIKDGTEELGHYFNYDRELTLQLVRGLLVNKDRYGYMSCPCRLASSDYEKDKDIVCPCDYRGPMSRSMAHAIARYMSPKRSSTRN